MLAFCNSIIFLVKVFVMQLLSEGNSLSHLAQLLFSPLSLRVPRMFTMSPSQCSVSFLVHPVPPSNTDSWRQTSTQTRLVFIRDPQQVEIVSNQKSRPRFSNYLQLFWMSSLNLRFFIFNWCAENKGWQHVCQSDAILLIKYTNQGNGQI